MLSVMGGRVCTDSYSPGVSLVGLLRVAAAVCEAGGRVWRFGVGFTVDIDYSADGGVIVTGFLW